MSNLVEAILENDLVTANELFEQGMQNILSKKLVEMKKKVSAELYESSEKNDVVTYRYNKPVHNDTRSEVSRLLKNFGHKVESHGNYHISIRGHEASIKRDMKDMKEVTGLPNHTGIQSGFSNRDHMPSGYAKISKRIK